MLLRGFVTQNIITEDENYISCVHDIYKKYGETQTLIVKNSEKNTLNFNFNSSVILNGNCPLNILNKLSSFDYYILAIDDLLSLNDFLKNIHQFSVWNNSAKHLIVYFGNEFPTNIFKITWQYYIVNIVLLYVQNETFWSIFPYDNSCEDITPRYLGKCGDDLNALGNFYRDKVPLQLKGCVVRLMGLKITPYVINMKEDGNDPKLSGLEVTIIHTVAQRMNFTEKYIPNPYPHWGYLLANGSFTLMYKYLYDGQVDFIFGKFMIILILQYLQYKDIIYYVLLSFYYSP